MAEGKLGLVLLDDLDRSNQTPRINSARHKIADDRPKSQRQRPPSPPQSNRRNLLLFMSDCPATRQHKDTAIAEPARLRRSVRRCDSEPGARPPLDTSNSAAPTSYMALSSIHSATDLLFGEAALRAHLKDRGVSQLAVLSPPVKWLQAPVLQRPAASE